MVSDLPRYDLHFHSTASDGVLSPLELVKRALQRDVQILALTDHDTLGGYDQIRYAPEAEQLTLISGIELTAHWLGRMVHIVGLNFHPDNVALRSYLEGLAQLRAERAMKISERLVKAGVHASVYEDAQKLAGDGIIGRPHFARAMVEKGFVSSEQAAFKQYLGAGKTGDVKMQWPDISQAVSIITEAGGVAVLAHPTKYKMTFTKIRALADAFKSCGGTALEVSYTGITPSHQADLERLARGLGIMISAGSDFHSPAQGWTDIGKFPPPLSIEPHVLHAIMKGVRR